MVRTLLNLCKRMHRRRRGPASARRLCSQPTQVPAIIIPYVPVRALAPTDYAEAQQEVILLCVPLRALAPTDLAEAQREQGVPAASRRLRCVSRTQRLGPRSRSSSHLSRARGLEHSTQRGPQPCAHRPQHGGYERGGSKHGCQQQACRPKAQRRCGAARSRQPRWWVVIRVWVWVCERCVLCSQT